MVLLDGREDEFRMGITRSEVDGFCRHIGAARPRDAVASGLTGGWTHILVSVRGAGRDYKKSNGHEQISHFLR